MAVLSDLTIKVAHCTQLHDVWPYGPLVYPTASDNDKICFSTLITIIYLSKVLTERFSILYKTQTKEDIRFYILTLVLVDMNFTFSAKFWIQL